jgi:hypothetical protein
LFILAENVEAAFQNISYENAVLLTKNDISASGV